LADFSPLTPLDLEQVARAMHEVVFFLITPPRGAETPLPLPDRTKAQLVTAARNRDLDLYVTAVALLARKAALRRGDGDQPVAHLDSLRNALDALIFDYRRPKRETLATLRAVRSDLDARIGYVADFKNAGYRFRELPEAYAARLRLRRAVILSSHPGLSVLCWRRLSRFPWSTIGPIGCPAIVAVLVAIAVAVAVRGELHARLDGHEERQHKGAVAPLVRGGDEGGGLAVHVAGDEREGFHPFRWRGEALEGEFHPRLNVRVTVVVFFRFTPATDHRCGTRSGVRMRHADNRLAHLLADAAKGLHVCPLCQNALVDSRLVGVGDQGLVGLEVQVALDTDAEWSFDAFKFRETDVSKLGETETEVTEAKRDIVILGIDFAEEPRCRAARVEQTSPRA
jgi:hypothetical protein